MKVVVTAGPTREFLDPVRFLSNRSTGKMGYAIASAFSERGHEVILISGPVALDPPASVKLIDVVSASDMLDAVSSEFIACDCLVMTAAVADWRPAEQLNTKMKKGASRMTLELEATEDILKQLAKARQTQILAGFAAETGDPLEESKRKLAAKGLDVVFGNNVSQSDAGFESDTNRLCCVTSDGAAEEWPLMSKAEAGQRIAQKIENIHDSRRK
jgi:phosphopantothenoylcysteine decarboxylase/phosphopantothenate--cysteine ligase